MAIVLTPEQEARLAAVVTAGIYPTAEEALEAAIAGVAHTAAHGFEGSGEELDALLLEGLRSRMSPADEAWARVMAETDQMLADYRATKPR